MGLAEGNALLDKLEADRQAIIQAELDRIEAERLAALNAAAWAAHPAGNDYTYRSCTWWVAVWTKVPPGLGNANNWYDQAKEWGFNVGSEPRSGAVGVTTRGRWGHVVLVLETRPDGSILIREGNYDYYGGVRERTAQADEFSYIYF